jgi:hypothetical protein
MPLRTDSEGNVTRYKARLVADGNRQIMGVDVNDIFAPTASFAARRVLLSVAAARDMEVHQVDIKTAFLNGRLNEDVYMKQPPGFDKRGSRHGVQAEAISVWVEASTEAVVAETY